jgi:hypothetical protein
VPKASKEALKVAKQMRLSNPLLLASLGALVAAASCTLITDVDRSKIPDGQSGAPSTSGGDGNMMPQGGEPPAGGTGNTPIGGAPEGGMTTMPPGGSGTEAGSGGVPTDGGTGGVPPEGGAAGSPMLPEAGTGGGG